LSIKEHLSRVTSQSHVVSCITAFCIVVLEDGKNRCSKFQKIAVFPRCHSVKLGAQSLLSISDCIDRDSANYSSTPQTQVLDPYLYYVTTRCMLPQPTGRNRLCPAVSHMYSVPVFVTMAYSPSTVIVPRLAMLICLCLFTSGTYGAAEKPNQNHEDCAPRMPS